jgi:hypothetical protein
MQTNDEVKDKLRAEIDKKVETMNPVDQVCARTCVNVAQLIAALLTSNDIPRLQELERIIGELFLEASKAKEVRKNLQ